MRQHKFAGWWYATGPCDRAVSLTDPSVAIYRVIQNESSVQGCALVKAPDGRKFPLEHRILQEIAQPPTAFPIA